MLSSVVLDNTDTYSRMDFIQLASYDFTDVYKWEAFKEKITFFDNSFCLLIEELL